jgi:hypothetical protein
MGFFPKRNVPGSHYLLARVEAEVQLAERAVDQHAADAHHKLADSYLGQLFGDEPSILSAGRRALARPENRQALLEIFNRYGEDLGREIERSPDRQLAELLERLDARSPSKVLQ